MHISSIDNERGFTLVELLVTLAILLIVVAALSSTFTFQQKTYDAQQQVSEMIQNGRAAMDLMTGEIMMSGYGVATKHLPLSNWITWVSGVTFGNDPIVIEDGAGALGSDILHVAGCLDGPVTTLAADAPKGATSITVDSAADINANDDKSNICINGLESAIVTAISGNTLTIDTDPSASGNQGLSNSFTHDDASGNHIVEICVVKVISYEIVQDDDGSYTLKRDENLDAGRQPMAENIVDMQITQVPASGDIMGVEINPLTSRTDKKDPGYAQNGGYRTYDLRSIITPPNLGF
ncbi:prepilin-type N-terminal cleavage/methylation domain protein [delta proteobacterium NaphS2]|nr:prepilin-type N-terminal cleavage/methylation domain protein [delta proteobacterium NaphS2]